MESELQTVTPDLVTVFSGTHKEAMEISLLLASQSKPHQIYVENEIYLIQVTSGIGEAVQDLITLYRKENHNWLTEFAQNADIGIFASPLLFLIPVTVGYFFQFSREFLNYNITLAGRSDSVKILTGDWWRVFTALTLHSGPQHFLSNMLSGFFLINLLVHRMAFGFAMLLVFLSSGLANFTVAIMTASGHRSIGFSTAVFAALGVLAAVQLRENFSAKRFSKRALIPLFGAILMVAFMGMGEGTDIRAHCLGTVWGIITGYFLAPLDNKHTRPLGFQFGFVILVYGVLGLSWMTALVP